MKILIIAYPNLKKDPRPYRQIKALYKNHEVHTAGYSESGLEASFFKLGKHKFFIEIFRLILLKLGFYNFYYWDKYKLRVLKKLKETKYDLIIAHEIRLLPLALKISKNSKIILDAHEYSPKNYDDSLLWRFFIKKYYTYLCYKYIPKVSKLISVSPGIVEEYNKNFKTDAELITNASEYYENLTPKKINEKKIRIIHHGIASSSRKLELIVEMMKFLDNSVYELNLMLVSSTFSSLYLRKLKTIAKGLNIVFLKPVSRNRLVKFCNQFDIGIHFVPPTNFNLKYGLGNKFFEYVQSRLAIAIGPDIEMSKYIKKYDLGIISKDWTPQSIANSIASVNSKKLFYHKNQSHKYSENLSEKSNTQKFLKLIKSFN